jgi:hypothetical protein
VRSPSVPPELDALVMRLLEKEPGRRFQSARELGRALAELTDRIDALDQTIERQPTLRAPILPRAATPPVAPVTPRPGPPLPSDPTALAPLLEPTAATRLDWLKSAPRRFLDDRRIWMPVAGAGVLLLLLALVMRSGGDHTKKPDALAPARPIAPTTAGGEDAPPPASVELVITSIPSGAMVIDEANGERLGPSPFRVRRPATPGVRTFVLKLDGFEPEVVTIRTDVSSEAQVVLAPLPAAPTAPAAPAAPAAPPVDQPR